MNIAVRENGTVETMAVMVTNDGGLVQIETYPVTAEGNKKAQDLFKGHVKDLNPKLSDDSLEYHLKQGFYVQGFTTVFIAYT